MIIPHRIGSLPKIALNSGFGGIPFDWCAPGTFADPRMSARTRSG